MMSQDLPNITLTDAQLRQGAEEGMDAFLRVITDRYLQVTGGELNASTMPLLNGMQHSLLGYRFLCDELNEGGFCQLIQNGYGPYIFDNPFAKALRLMGAQKLSKIIYAAKKIYDAHRDDLQRERTDEEFMAMYEQYEAFDDLEEEFMDIEELETAHIAEYVDDHLADFIQVEH
jgi:hypothetical protein